MALGTLATEADLQRAVEKLLLEKFGTVSFHRIAGELNGSKLEDGTVPGPALEDNAVSIIYVGTATTSGPTTTSTADPMTAVIPEMTITQDFGGDPLLISFSTSINRTGGGDIEVALYDGSTEISDSRRRSNSAHETLAIPNFAYTPAAGSRTIEARWHILSGTSAAATGTQRQLTILRLKA